MKGYGGKAGMHPLSIISLQVVWQDGPDDYMQLAVLRNGANNKSSCGVVYKFRNEAKYRR
jgi:hypothetical protein